MNTHLARRNFLSSGVTAIGSLGLTWLLNSLPAAAAAPAGNAAGVPHFPAKAKSVIFLFMGGGPSHIDMFDPKPVLNRFDQKEIPLAIRDRKIQTKKIGLACPFEFRPYGQSGTRLSSLVPHLGSVVDEIAFVHSVTTDRIDHSTAQFTITTGRATAGFPSIGSWVTYALGAETQNLPASVALVDGRLSIGSRSWGPGFLPPSYGATRINLEGDRIFDVSRPSNVSPDEQEQFLSAVGRINRLHQEQQPDFAELDSRIRNFELAARMQMEVVRRTDLSTESESTKQMYGIDKGETREFGTACLLARKLIESGVRFITIGSGDWDHHRDIFPGISTLCRRTDMPTAALIRDLRQRGLLDSTLIVWGGEFGRMPTVDGPTHPGRDHNPFGFTMWLAGGGIKGGTHFGATDEFGWKAVENPLTHSDIHATILNQLGLDFRKVTYPHEGRDESLVGVNPARVIREILL